MNFEWIVTSFGYEEILKKHGIVDIGLSKELRYIHIERLNRELEVEYPYPKN